MEGNEVTAVIQVRDGGHLNEGSGNQDGEKCPESGANSEVNFLELGRWIDVGWEWGSIPTPSGSTSELSQTLFLKSPSLLPLKRGFWFFLLTVTVSS